jgi:hypothetical protein
VNCEKQTLITYTATGDVALLTEGIALVLTFVLL